MRLVSEINQTAVVSTSELNKRLGMPVTSTFLKSIGILPFAELSQGVYWLEADLPHIRDAIVSYLNKVSFDDKECQAGTVRAD